MGIPKNISVKKLAQKANLPVDDTILILMEELSNKSINENSVISKQNYKKALKVLKVPLNNKDLNAIAEIARSRGIQETKLRELLYSEKLIDKKRFKYIPQNMINDVHRLIKPWQKTPSF